MEIPFPVGPRAQLTPQLVHGIALDYGLGHIAEAKDLGGAYNLNLRLNTERGAFVARVYRPWVEPRRLTAVQAAKVELQRDGIPTVLPIRTTFGATYVTYQQRLVEVEPYIEHDAPTESWPSYEKASAFLGRLHRALATNPDRRALPPPAVENYAEPLGLVGLIHQVQERIDRTDHALRTAALRTTAEALEVLATVSTWWRSEGLRLPQQVVHGDYGIGNLLMHQSRVVGLVDLEFLAVHERVFDLAYISFWMMQRVEAGVAYADRSWGRVGEMIAKYHSTNPAPLTDAEWRALPIEMARVPLHWIGEAIYLPNAIEAVAEHAEHVALASWIVKHPSEIGQLP